MRTIAVIAGSDPADHLIAVRTQTLARVHGVRCYVRSSGEFDDVVIRVTASAAAPDHACHENKGPCFSLSVESILGVWISGLPWLADLNSFANELTQKFGTDAVNRKDRAAVLAVVMLCAGQLMLASAGFDVEFDEGRGI